MSYRRCLSRGAAQLATMQRMEGEETGSATHVRANIRTNSTAVLLGPISMEALSAGDFADSCAECNE